MIAIGRVSPTDATVLVWVAYGAGKELVALAIRQHSSVAGTRSRTLWISKDLVRPAVRRYNGLVSLKETRCWSRGSDRHEVCVLTGGRKEGAELP